MAKYYPKPKRLLNPRAVHLYDLVALVVMFAVALTVLPLGTTLDLSVGFNEKSPSYMAFERQEITDSIQNAKYDSKGIEALFESTTIQNGGTVYRISEDKYYFYQDGEEGYTYYYVHMGGSGVGEAPTSAGEDLPRGLMLQSSYFSVADDGRIYFDNLDGASGWTDLFVDLEQVDMEGLTELLSTEAALNPQQVATIWSLTQRNILIGYCDRQVWFHSSRDGVSTIYRGTQDGVEAVHTVEGELRNVMVAFNKLLFYIKDGKNYLQYDGSTVKEVEGYIPTTSAYSEGGHEARCSKLSAGGDDIIVETTEKETSKTESKNKTTSKANSKYQVYIDSPTGVEVYVDGNYIGIAPVSMNKEVGNFVITLRKTGYQTRSYTVQIDDGDSDVNYSFAELMKLD